MGKDNSGNDQVNISGANFFSTFTSFTDGPKVAFTLMAARANNRICITDIAVEANTACTYSIIRDVGGAASATCYPLRNPFAESKHPRLRNPIVISTATGFGFTSNCTVGSIFVSGYLD